MFPKELLTLENFSNVCLKVVAGGFFFALRLSLNNFLGKCFLATGLHLWAAKRIAKLPRSTVIFCCICLSASLSPAAFLPLSLKCICMQVSFRCAFCTHFSNVSYLRSLALTASSSSADLDLDFSFFFFFECNCICGRLLQLFTLHFLLPRLRVAFCKFLSILSWFSGFRKVVRFAF